MTSYNYLKAVINNLNKQFNNKDDKLLKGAVTLMTKKYAPKSY